jgi:hypothetical protein
VPSPEFCGETPQQRLIAIEPACQTAATWRQADPSVVKCKGWLFNDSDETCIVATVGHMEGGYISQHALASRLLRDGWMSMCDSERGAYPLDWIVLYAIQEAEAQGLDRLEHYLLALETVGAYVMAHPGGQCAIDTGVEGGPIGKDRSPLWVSGSVGSSPTMQLELGRRGEVLMEVYDIAGRFVSRLHDGLLDAGRYQFTWLGFTGAGTEAPDGVYFVRAVVDGEALDSQRLVLVR